MSDSSSSGFSIWGLTAWVFLAIKLAGTALAAWSWWWLLMPMVPIVALILRHFNLLN